MYFTDVLYLNWFIFYLFVIEAQKLSLMQNFEINLIAICIGLRAQWLILTQGFECDADIESVGVLLPKYPSPFHRYLHVVTMKRSN
jgi:hypothetical protein